MVRLLSQSVIAIGTVLLSSSGGDAAKEARAPGKWTLLPLTLAYNATEHMCTWASSSSFASNSSVPHPPDRHPIALIIGGTQKYTRRPLRRLNAYDFNARTVTELRPAPLQMQEGASAVVQDVLYIYQPSYFNQGRVPGYENTTILTYGLKTNQWDQIPISETAVRPSRGAAGGLVQWFPDKGQENLLLYQCDGIWSFNLKNKEWKAVEVKGERPPCLSGAAIAASDGRGEAQAFYLVGGTTEDGAASSTVWKYTVKSQTWSRLQAEFPLAVTSLSAAVDGDTLYTFGGWRVSENAAVDSFYSLRLNRPRAQWRAIQVSPAPLRRFGSCMLPQVGRATESNPAKEEEAHGVQGVLLFGGIEEPVPGKPRHTGDDIWAFSAATDDLTKGRSRK